MTLHQGIDAPGHEEVLISRDVKMAWDHSARPAGNPANIGENIPEDISANISASTADVPGSADAGNSAGADACADDAMAAGIDLDLYFARIGYDGPREASLAVLRELHTLHPANIPFEAIDVLRGRAISMHPAIVDHKLLVEGRGGYCFEHNSVFLRALRSLGFVVDTLPGRVLWGKIAPGSEAAYAATHPHCHMALRVVIDGEAWLADVGLGECVPTAPLLLDVSAPQVTAHDTYRVRRRQDAYLIEVEREGGWLPVHLIDAQPSGLPDFEVMNWYSATHPDSEFRNALVVARSATHARFSLFNNRLTIRLRNGGEERHILSVGDLEQTLHDIFGIRPDPQWRPYLEQAAGMTVIGH